jgi:hypothetical protein
MAIDTTTITLLTSVLSSETVRKLFKTIANSRIAEKSLLKQADPQADQALGALQEADLIGSGSGGSKYYITAKGLKVARDLEQIPLG